MSRRPIEPGIDPRGVPVPEEDPEKVVEDFREAMARWASGVSLVALRDPDDQNVYATTISSLGSVSARPPRIVLSLGPGAQVLPFLEEGRRFVVNGLTRGQKGLAARFTDSFPVGPSPFPSEGDPVVEGAHFTLTCTVERVVSVDNCRLVLGRVEEAVVGDDAAGPLLYYLRDYRVLE